MADENRVQLGRVVPNYLGDWDHSTQTYTEAKYPSGRSYENILFTSDTEINAEYEYYQVVQLDND